MNFLEAVKAMKEGHRVKTKVGPITESFMEIEDPCENPHSCFINQKGKPLHITPYDLAATDWEIISK